MSTPRQGAVGVFQRDRPETAFSRLLAGFVEAHPGVRAAVFVDIEGECVDYASHLDPYEAMVFSATLLNPTKGLIEVSLKGGAGQPIQWLLSAERLDALVRRVSEDLFLTLWLEPGGISAQVLSGVGPLVASLRQESGLDPVAKAEETLDVDVRKALGWGYAPRAIRTAASSSVDLEVLGRWTEAKALEDEREAVCFRVRAQDQEWTLVHDPVLQRWYRR